MSNSIQNIHDDSALLAVLGVFSVDVNFDLRDLWRKHILSSKRNEDMGLLIRFVLRALHSTAFEEQSTHDDLFFLPAEATLSRRVGPLQSQLLWYPAALLAFPHARFIGKGDDDMYMHPQTLIAHLSALPIDDLMPTYWGALQCYHWSQRLFTPTHFCFDFIERRIGGCRVQRIVSSKGEEDVKTGPFLFAQGTLHFVSRSLAKRLHRNKTLHDEATRQIALHDKPRAMAAMSAVGCEGHHCLPYEDVWLGYAISQLQLSEVRFVQRPESSAFRHFPYCKDPIRTPCTIEFERAAAEAAVRAACDHAMINVTTTPTSPLEGGAGACVDFRHPTCGGAVQHVCGLHSANRRTCPGDDERNACKDDKGIEWCKWRKSHCLDQDGYVRVRCNATCGGCAVVI